MIRTGCEAFDVHRPAAGGGRHRRGSRLACLLHRERPRIAARSKTMTLIPTQVTFRGLDQSDAVETDIRDRVAWLEQFYDEIVGCRVLIERSDRHRHDGRHFHVRIELTVPGGRPVVVSHEPSLHGRSKDTAAPAHHKRDEVASVHRYAHVAIHDAFDAARRALQDFAREQRGAVKPRHAAVATPR
jgi:hypothetical protein